MDSHRALLLGATGLVGRELLRLLLEEPFYDRIVVLARRSTGVVHPKLEEHLLDLERMHEHPELLGRRLVEVLADVGLATGAAMSALRRYELSDAAQQPFETLSGGQQARLQILLLELTGATLLLLDEPTDNLDVASAEALEEALRMFTGTVLAVTHDRWFMRSFDRFLVFGRDGSVVERAEPAYG